MQVHSFPPVASPGARVLILGTMPGAASLRERQYYAHPQNQFWRIVGALLGFDPASPYEARLAALRAADIAVWDVLQTCIRPGSMDAAIVAASAVPNDIPGLLAAHPQIGRVFFNGGGAERLYRRHVLPRLAAASAVAHLRLPSTSPAYAKLPYTAKLQAWQAILS